MVGGVINSGCFASKRRPARRRCARGDELLAQDSRGRRLVMFGGDEVSAIVMDLGSSATKSGYAGEDCPKFVIPSSVGITAGEESAAQEGPPKRTFHVGTNALSVPRAGMTVDGALRDGIVHDWDAAEALMEHSLKNCLGCDPTDHPLLMAEPSFNPTANRLKLTEIAFEKFNVPALFLSKNAVLAGTAEP